PFSESSAMAARSCATSSGLISVVSATRFSNWASSSAENDFLSGFSSACLAGFGESTDLPDSVDAAGFAGSDETDGDSMYPACPADSASACCGIGSGLSARAAGTSTDPDSGSEKRGGSAMACRADSVRALAAPAVILRDDREVEPLVVDPGLPEASHTDVAA